MEDLYPPEMRGKKLGGTSHVLMLVGPDSVPQNVEVVQSSGQFPFDVASVRLMGRTRIAPGMYQGCPVWAVVTFPVGWEQSRRR